MFELQILTARERNRAAMPLRPAEVRRAVGVAEGQRRGLVREVGADTSTGWLGAPVGDASTTFRCARRANDSAGAGAG